jgi:hypothetical protein
VKVHAAMAVILERPENVRFHTCIFVVNTYSAKHAHVLYAGCERTNTSDNILHSIMCATETTMGKSCDAWFEAKKTTERTWNPDGAP